ncbi:MAG: hypothetical protein AVO33_07780 [delta proteobacterium ML8_F1]|nr:MAG: hypothetical protein AVO33_07780 [delta proteobacterium ML8_F1]
MKVPFNAPQTLYQKELEAVFRKRFGMEEVFFTTSCSSALDMAAQIIEAGPGDEIILPSFTYVTTAMGFARRGARLVFTDIDPRTGVLDLKAVQGNLTKRTKAVIPVHYAGVSMDLDSLRALQKEGDFYVIEDAAQAIGARYKGRYLGTIGDMGTFSFHYTKNISTGEGGALLMNNSGLKPRARVVFEKGTDRHDFIAGIKSEYSWVDFGGSYEMSEILKGRLLKEMEQLEAVIRKREALYRRYEKHFRSTGLRSLEIPGYAQSNFHIFALVFDARTQRDRMLKVLNQHGIQGTFHYQPLHKSPFGLKAGYDRFYLPETEAFAGGILRLPLYPGLSEDTVDTIAEIILKEWRNI